MEASTSPPGQPPAHPPGHLTFLKIIVQILPYPSQNAVQMPHTGVHSGARGQNSRAKRRKSLLQGH